jgi:Ni/Fe-hydrogenase subunit HybB-like protein
LTYLPQEITTIYTTYFPSTIEILSGLGVIAYGALAITLGVRYLNLIDHGGQEKKVTESPIVIPATD